MLPKVAIVGVGGVGGVLAASLHAAGKCALTVVSRGKGLETLRTAGLHVTMYEGHQYHASPLKVMSINDDVVAEKQDFVLITTKSHQLTPALDTIHALVGPQTTIVPCINGLPWWFSKHHVLPSTDPEGRLSKEISVDQVLGTVGMVSGNVAENYEHWESRWPSERNLLTIGEPFGNNGGSTRAHVLAGLFDATHPGGVTVNTKVVSNIRSQIYDKILINCSLNTIGAICGIDCGMTVDRTPRLVRMLVDEAVQVATVAFHDDGPLKLSLTADEIMEIYRGQYGLQTSMLRDVNAGRRTEVDAIVRPVVELGEIYGVPTPGLCMVADMIDAIECKGQQHQS